ncbi:hypothetical protein B9T23_16365 [Acinetobacter terrae]|uniref:hypothetical protein n=1 Tax=Acinetobacter terrae TaxID=2731247 RepID=UPI000A350AF2|nr:hypothetical protein [Acinetobacter terrae]OTG70303.1 hypothetical protein B9T23_16365 [Acinetobacter terrae]
MNFRTIILIGGVGIALHGCTSIDSFNSDSVKNFTSPQELIVQKNINAANGRAKEYVYSWGSKQSNKEPQSLYPRKHLNSYCSAKHGKFSVLHKSSMSLVKNQWDKKLLSTYSSVKQGIGAYKCVQSDGQSWIVSIEPVAERKLDDGSDARMVALQTKIMTALDAQKFYSSANSSNNSAAKKTTVNNQTAKNTPSKTTTPKEVEVKKEAETKKETKPTPPLPVKQSVQVVETPQQQQLKSYVAARRDLNSGKNQVAACNNAQRAYNYGKLQGTDGTKVYTESGMLVARCLTSVPSYSSRFSSSKGQAVKILQNLANNYNHAGAKNMLRQIK